jgi:hypothetical protein
LGEAPLGDDPLRSVPFVILIEAKDTSVDEALCVFVDAKDRRTHGGLVRANPFKDARAVVKRVRQDRNFGLFLGNKLAVEPDVTGLLRRGTRRSRFRR